MSVKCRDTSCDGFAILEVLIAIVILAFGILGLAGLHSRALSAEMESYQRGQAMLIAEDMADRIQTSRKDAGSYVGIYIKTSAGDCSKSGVVQTDCVAWANTILGAAEQTTSNVGAMIGAQGCVSLDADGLTYRVTVVWQGLSSTAAPPASVTCGVDTFKGPDGATDDTYRRWVSVQFRVADQSSV